MATYSTDLTTTLTTAEAGTWTEFASPYNGGGTPAANTEGFIQGTGCFSQTTGKAVGLAISCVFDNGSNVTFATDEVVFAWCFYANGVNLETYANSGWRFGIGSSVSAWDWFRIGGSNYGRNPYGGWTNFAIDPTATESGVIGGGNGNNYRYFGSVPYTLAEITKGEPSAVDAIRKGRGIISVTGTGGSFLELSSYNDYNAGGTPPGTSSTSIDTGRHRLGLFQDNGGTYLWKGLLSLGTVGSSVTFSDSNATIIIDDCPHTYPSFNKIEINNASSSVTLNNISVISTASTTNGVGYFDMIANATVSKTGCLFVDMGTFIYQSNATITNTSYVSCGQITHGGATFSTCNFQGYEGTAGTAYMNYAVVADPDGELDDCSFTKGTAATHAIEFDATNTPTTITLRGINFSGYNATNGNNDSALYFPSTSKSYTVNLIGCSGNISYRVGTGGSVTLVSDPVTVQVTVRDAGTGGLISGARVLLEVADGTNFPYLASISISGTGTTATVTHTAHGLATNDYVVIRGSNADEYNGVYQITVTGTNTYTYNTGETVTTGSPTGTITSTLAIISGVTSGTGILTDSRTYGSNQPVTGKVRKATSSPLYVQGSISETVNNTTGLSVTVQLVRDE